MTQKKIILPRYKIGMSVSEFDRLYMEDLETTKRRWKYHYKDLRHRVLKAPRFPMRYMFKEMHGKEELRAYTEIESKRQPFITGLDLDSVIYFKNSRGTCAYINLDPFKVTCQKMVFYSEGQKNSHRYLFTPHFFERYEMRYGWDDGYSDIHNQFFFNNLSRAGRAFYTQMTKARPNDYKTFDVWSLCEDGLMLGEVKNENDFNEGRDYIIQINTFLDLDTLTRRQNEYTNILESMRAVFDKLELPETESDIKKRTFITHIKNL